MATGIWDPTLFNGIQIEIHECLKFSVVRDFCLYIAKRKTIVDPDPESATCVMLERYDGALQKTEKEKDYSTVRFRMPNLGGWLKNKSMVGDKPKDKKNSFLGRTRNPKVRPTIETILEEPAAPQEESDSTEVGLLQRERLTQQHLQQQIQLLRTLHQHQHENFKQPDSQYNTLEFASTTSNATPLAKSISMPTIIRGLSMADFKSPRK